MLGLVDSNTAASTAVIHLPVVTTITSTTPITSAHSSDTRAIVYEDAKQRI